MKRAHLLLIAMASLMMLGCGGGDDAGSSAGGSGGGNSAPTTSAPVVSSVTPANGATDIAIGDVAITVTYDQTVQLASTDKSKIQISGGTITALSASGKEVKMTANCPENSKTVAITISKDLVTNANS